MPESGSSGTLLRRYLKTGGPRLRKKEPDPFTEGERDRILEFYKTKRPHWLMLLFFSVSTLALDLVKRQH